MTSWARAAGINLLFTFVLIVGGPAGCHSASNRASTSSSAGVAGNWQFTATYGKDSKVPIGAYLTISGGSISGVAQVQKRFSGGCDANGCCGGPFSEFDRLVTGSVDGSGNVTLRSVVPGGGPVFSMTGYTSHGSMAQGNFTLSGSCPAQGTITGTRIPALHGTYAGTLTSETTGENFNILVTLDQSKTLNPKGSFNVSGGVRLQGYSCLSSARIATPLDHNSGLLGNAFKVTMKSSAGGAMLGLTGTVAQGGQTLKTTYAVIGGSCRNDFGRGTLTLQ